MALKPNKHRNRARNEIDTAVLLLRPIKAKTFIYLKVNTCSYKGEQMHFNKTTLKILQLFTRHITEKFTLRETARKLEMQISLAHRAIQPLLENSIINQDKHKLLSLNYKENHADLAFAEYQTTEDFLSKNTDIKLFAKEVISKIKEDCFMLIIFGSATYKKNPRDIDILLIVNDTDKIEFHEKFLHKIASNYELLIEERVISTESVYEMLSAQSEKNVMNETLNKHIILYGAELFYRILSKTR